MRFRVRWATSTASGRRDFTDEDAALCAFYARRRRLTFGKEHGWVSFARDGVVERISSGGLSDLGTAASARDGVEVTA